MRSTLLSAVLLSSVVLVACEEGPKPPLKTAYSAANNAQGNANAGAWNMPGTMPGRRADVSSPTAGSIQIDARILQACGNIPSARFAFDSAKINGEAETVLGALAWCFVSGPLAGHELRLVGHTDPRGGVSYNIALGQQRAGSVAAYLNQRGLSEDRMGTLSKGAFEATGIDEEGWALDRKVEVVLAD